MLFNGIVKDRLMVVCELVDGKLRTVYDLLKDDQVTKLYPNLFLTSSSLNLPYLECVDAVDFSAVFPILEGNEEPSEDLIMQIKAAIDGVVKLSVEDYKLLWRGSLAFNNYFNEERVEINIPKNAFRNFTQTCQLVEKVNKTSATFSVSGNKTLFRDNENSELFIMVPSPDSLSFAEDLSSFIPSMKNVFVPFEERGLYGHDYKNYLKSNGLNVESVLGNPNMNTLELYPEELRYYNALVELHNALMDREHPNNSVEECVKFKEYSELFKNYMCLMITEVLRYHRNHSGFISLESYVDDDDDEEKEADSSSDSLSVNLFYSGSRKGNFDGETLINALVEDQIKKDVYAPIRLLIQALRFGFKIPSKLELVDGRFFDLKEFSYTNSSGSFSSYTVKKTPSGNNYSVLGVVNCNDKILDSEYAKSIGFTRPKLTSPVGLVLKKSFENSEDYQLTLISFLDLVRFIGLDETLTIDGISKVDGELRVDESVISNDLLEESSSLTSILSDLDYPVFVSYVNPIMKGDYLECNCFSNDVCQLELLKTAFDSPTLKQLNLFVVVSKEDVLDKVKSYKLSPKFLLNSTVSYYLVDLVAKADEMLYDISMDKFTYSISDVISVYSHLVESLGLPLGVYTDRDGDLIRSLKSSRDDRDPSETNSVNSSSTSEIKESNVFSSQEEKSETKYSEEGGNMYNLDNLFYDGDFETVIPIVLPTETVNKVNTAFTELNDDFRVKSLNNNSEVTVVGYLTQVDGMFVLLEPKNYDKPSKGKFTLTKFKANILGMLRKIAAKEVSKVRFSSPAALDYYCRILEKC